LAGEARGWLYFAHGIFDHFHQAKPWRSQKWGQEGTQSFLEVNAQSSVKSTKTLWGLVLASLGDVSRAVEVMWAQGNDWKGGHKFADHFLQVHLSLVLTSSTQLTHHQEACQLSMQIVETEKVNVMLLGLAQVVLAKVAALQGQFSEAEARARKACEMLDTFVYYRLMAYTTLSAVLLAQQRVVEARAEAEQGVKALEKTGDAGAMSVPTWLALAEACFAQADTAAGENALRKAVRCLRLRAEDIPEEAARERFLSQVPENARTRDLARQRWGANWDSPLIGESC
jgi:tetratricopeptide (TPR) repeat protein